MITRLNVKNIILLVWIVVLSGGCIRATLYGYNGKYYASRTVAESVQNQIWEKRLEMCQTAYQIIDEKCLLVLPTSHWFKENWYRDGRGFLPKADLDDYMIAIGTKEIENVYQIIIKSGLFSQSEIVQAAVGTGQDEQLGYGKTFEARVKVIDKGWYLEIINSENDQSVEFGGLEVVYSAVYGWDALYDQIKELL